MSKIRIMSDLHLEFGPIDIEPIGEDILALVGDIGTYTMGSLWAANYARKHSIPTVMIAGNHEFYCKKTIDDTTAAIHDIADNEPLFHFVDDQVILIDDVRFVGGTMWTDFALNGNVERDKHAVSQALNDYRMIHEGCLFGIDAEKNTRLFVPEDAFRRHAITVGVIDIECEYGLSDKPIVVMTHHLPSAKSLDGRYKNSRYNAGYASNLDSLVEKSGAALWLHGHTHISKDYMIGNTRIICNPRGYVGDETNPQFNPDLIVEVNGE